MRMMSFLTYVCYDLFKKKQYDKVILTYLANFYCGATQEMKELWKVAREYEVHTHKLAERIITQMPFFRGIIPGDKSILKLIMMKVHTSGSSRLIWHMSPENML